MNKLIISKFFILDQKYSLVDIQHFLFNMMLACDMTPELLYEYYVSKNKENIRRQLNNY